MKLFGRVGTLEVPKYRQVAAIPGCLGDKFDLLQERGLADPASAEQPDAVPGPVEDFSNLGRTAVKMVASHPLPDDERYDRGHGVTNRPLEGGFESLDLCAQSVPALGQRLDRLAIGLARICTDGVQIMAEMVDAAADGVFSNDNAGPDLFQ